jgi:MFS transporter, MHS family, shikimate and dehydroshikimate transport protein
MARQKVASGQAHQPVDLRSMTILAFSATAGVLVEFYDFFIFGYAAASAFPAIFFPNLSPTLALVFSYLTFGAGFPARLFGAFLFGHFGDSSGRKWAFLINILMVGTATCLAGLLPGYGTLGLAAPILLLILRFIQGIGLGGEFGGASSLLAEFGARRRHRAFWMSLANLGIPGGAMAASATLFFLSGSFTTYGWRIAMLLSVVIVIPALLARYKLADTPLFERLKQQDELSKLPSLDVLRRHARPILLLALIQAFAQMDGYVSGTYIISLMSAAGLPLAASAAIIFTSRIGNVAGIVASGPCADLLKRKNVAYIAILFTTFLSIPTVMAILNKHVVWVMILQFINFIGIGLMHGLAPILMSESFPTKYRYSGTGIAYSLSAVLGGMIAPPLLAALIGQDVADKWFFVPIVYGVYCLVAIVSLLFVRETRGIGLENLDRETTFMGTATEASPA